MLKRIRYNSIELENNTYYYNEIKKLTSKLEKVCALTIECPYCKQQAEIEVPTNLFTNPTQIIRVIIPKKAICKDSFSLYLDHSFNVRSYEKTDYTLKKKNIKKVFSDI